MLMLIWCFTWDLTNHFASYDYTKPLNFNNDIDFQPSGILMFLSLKGFSESRVGEMMVRSPYTPSPPTKSLGFEGFDSSRLLILRGGDSHVRRI